MCLFFLFCFFEIWALLRPVSRMFCDIGIRLTGSQGYLFGWAVL